MYMTTPEKNSYMFCEAKKACYPEKNMPMHVLRKKFQVYNRVGKNYVTMLNHPPSPPAQKCSIID